MIKTVVISEKASAGRQLNAMLAQSDYEVVFEAESVQSVLIHAWQDEPELIVVYLERPDSEVMAKFKLIHERSPLPVVIFTDDNRQDAIELAIDAGVSAYIVDGLQPTRILAILKTAIARFHREQSLKTQLHELKNALADRKLIDRAKGIIMQQRHCSEDEAYRLLRSSAMNQNMRLAVLAKNILSTANLLESAKTR